MTTDYAAEANYYRNEARRQDRRNRRYAETAGQSYQRAAYFDRHAAWLTQRPDLWDASQDITPAYFEQAALSARRLADVLADSAMRGFGYAAQYREYARGYAARAAEQAARLEEYRAEQAARAAAQASQDQAEVTAQAVRDDMPAGDAELAEWVVTRAGKTEPVAVVDLAERHVGTFLRRMGARYAVRGTVTEYADDDQAEALATEAERAAVLAYWLN
jgi:hypothetical protein